MNKSIYEKLLICIIFIVVLASSFCMSASYAIGDIFTDGKAFLQRGDSISNTIDTGELKGTSNYIYNALLGVAIMVAVIVAMVLGIQFMAASAEEKAKVKEALIPFIIGCFIVFGGITIWKIAVNIGNKTEDAIVTYKGFFDETYEGVMAISVYEIENNMSDEKKEAYKIALEGARNEVLQEDTLSAKEKEKRYKALDEREQIVEMALNPAYSNWYEYKGKSSNDEAYKKLVNTDINSFKSIKSLDDFVSVARTAKSYFEKLKPSPSKESLGIQRLLNNLSIRRNDIFTASLAALDPPDTEITENKYGGYIQKDGKYYCNYCADEFSDEEKKNAKCFNCGKEVLGWKSPFK